MTVVGLLLLELEQVVLDVILYVLLCAKVLALIHVRQYVLMIVELHVWVNVAKHAKGLVQGSVEMTVLVVVQLAL